MKKFFSLLIALTMMLVLLLAHAEEAPVYVALGDSISAGYGLAEDEPSFPQLVAERCGYTLRNHAVNGNTAQGILLQLADPAVQVDIAAADVITITCGGNDLMDLLYERVAALYNANVPALLAIKGDDVVTIMSAADDPRQQALLLAAKTVLEGNEALGVVPFVQSEDMKTATNNYLQNLMAVLSTIRKLNPDVTIIMATQYNPYGHFTNLYATLNDGVSAGVDVLNKYIGSYGMMLGYTVADVYTAFAGREGELMNASMDPLNLDFHPNAAGHALIAECVWTVLNPGK